MFSKAASKALWLAKGAALFWGAALTLALVFGVASMALGANGGNFILGQSNAATALTRLTGDVQGTTMQVINNNAGSDDTALNLQVQDGEAPMRITSDARVNNLNADKVDGLGAEEVGVNGLEVIVEDSPTNSDSSKSAIADCPDGKALIGTGYELIGGTSGTARNVQTDVVVTDVEPSTFSNQVDVTAFEEKSTTAEWLVQAHAICATAGTP